MHPYTHAPARAFWSRAVSRGFDTQTLIATDAPMIRQGEKTVSAGSCFAANLVPYLETAGFEYVRTEYRHPIFAKVAAENLSYGKFSAGYGNIYTARQMLQLLERALGVFVPSERYFEHEGEYVDPFRPGLRYRARSVVEFDLLQERHFRAALDAFRACDVFIFTLGLTEAWMSRDDGSVYPACPGTVAGTFDAARHAFVNFSVDEVTQDMSHFIALLRGLNPRVRVILTVSPVPLVATASDQHVVAATIYSKSVLRVAAEQIARTHDNVIYFPSYEIITGPQAPHSHFEADRRNPSAEGIAAVMDVFLGACETETEGTPLVASDTRQASPGPKSTSGAAELSRLLVEIECEEAMSDAQLAHA